LVGSNRSIPGWFRRLRLVCIALFALTMPADAHAEPRLIVVDTGAKTGVYYFAGGSICALVNAQRWTTGIRCIVRETDGSIENLLALRRGAADFAIAQSDWQFHAMQGSGPFETRGPDRNLRSVLALYPEPFTILARGGSGIRRLSDLPGKRVNIGPVGSGSRATMEAVMDTMGWSGEDFAHLADLGISELPQALCSGDLDAAVMVIAHPNLAVEDVLSACDVTLIPAGAAVIDRLLAERPYFFAYSIPSGAYPAQSASVDVFALSATLVTSAQTPPPVVREVVSALVGALNEFRARHPSFAEFDLRQMLSEGLTAPLHAAAAHYYDDMGLPPTSPGQ
jgi:TRAP transporter TAXI family solute receptor